MRRMWPIMWSRSITFVLGGWIWEWAGLSPQRSPAGGHHPPGTGAEVYRGPGGDEAILDGGGGAARGTVLAHPGDPHGPAPLSTAASAAKRLSRLWMLWHRRPLLRLRWNI